MLTRQASLDEIATLMSRTSLDARIEHGAAALNRELFAANGVSAICLAGRRNSGKTALLEATLQRLDGRLRAGAVIGNVNACVDAARIRNLCEQVAIVETTDLTATLLYDALTHVDLDKLDVLFIERGAAEEQWNQDLGQNAFVEVCAADGEGRELQKLVRCGKAVAHADLVILSKSDLLAREKDDGDQSEFDLADFVDAARHYNLGAPIIPISLVDGRGMQAWIEWLEERSAALCRA